MREGGVEREARNACRHGLILLKYQCLMAIHLREVVPPVPRRML